jgi:phage tail-like protein
MAYPLPGFRFQVEWGAKTIDFMEVTGLNFEVQVLEYRAGSSPDYSTIKMPGLRKYGNVTMKRGTFKGRNEYFEWYKTFKMHKPERRDVKISLLDEEGNPVVNWSLRAAWPTKITASDLKASANELAIETIELAHEGMTITYEGSVEV